MITRSDRPDTGEVRIDDPGHRPVILLSGSFRPRSSLMPVEMLSYAELGARLKISPEAARALAKRHRLPRSLSKDGKAMVSVDVAEIRHTPLPARVSGDDRPVTGPAGTKVEALQAKIARLEARLAGHRADYERERDRADRLMEALLKANAETVVAKETAARLEGQLLALRPGNSAASAAAADEKAVGGQEQQPSRVRRLAAVLAEADRQGW
jgi:hypothetical protein